MPDLPIDEGPTRAKGHRLTASDPRDRLGPVGLSIPGFPSAPPRRRSTRWSFLLMVVLPSLVAAFYFAQVAAPQYATNAVVALRIGDDQRDRGAGGASSLVGALGPSSAGAPITQSYGIVEYIRSMPAIEDISRSGLDLRAILTSERADPLLRLPPDAGPEALLAAWRRMVTASFELTRGVVTLSTRAFSPEDSLAMAEAVLLASERLANDMAQRMTADTVRAVEQQAAQAEARFAAALAELEEHRAASGVLDVGRASSAGIGIEMQLRQELATAEAQAENLRASGGQVGPMLAAATARARALRAQLGDVERQASRTVGERSGSAWAAVLARSEGLTASLRIAEQQYAQALGLLQSARAEAAQQRTYLLTFVRPILPGDATHPNRILSVLIVAGCALLAWAMVTLLYFAITDQT